MRRLYLPKGSDSADMLANELEGLIDLGATKQATKVVRQILRLRRPTALALWQAVRAVGMMNRPRRWRRDIEAAYDRLTKADQREVAGTLLAYYHSINEPELALRFCKLRDLRSAHDLMFAMELYLDTNDVAAAKKVAGKCLRLKVDDPFDESARAEALASYYSRTKNWELAYEHWTKAPRDQPLSRQAVRGGIEVLLAWALAAVEAELKTVSQLRSEIDPELDVSLPGIHNELLDQTEKDLLRFRRGIERMFSKDRQQAFGLP